MKNSSAVIKDNNEVKIIKYLNMPNAKVNTTLHVETFAKVQLCLPFSTRNGYKLCSNKVTIFVLGVVTLKQCNGFTKS